MLNNEKLTETFDICLPGYALYGLDAETGRYTELSVYLSGVLNKIVTRTML